MASEDKRGVCNLLCWSYVCLFYFLFAVLFLTAFGILCSTDSFLSLVEKDKRKNTAAPAFIALGLYGVCAVLSAYYLWQHRRKMAKGRTSVEGGGRGGQRAGSGASQNENMLTAAPQALNSLVEPAFENSNQPQTRGVIEAGDAASRQVEAASRAFQQFDSKSIDSATFNR